ncbi:LysR family transcriptional regulator [Okeania sp. SIO1I7]|uniref:LysR family transcriptional regulator n=1 Tax=Okeania sp. SIO1I7 TaxID=2607772 RepID=UPI0013F892F0|nr:LysR family transcriptional regulator [Okeania sp. SIO1I7]NET26665.1 LysR family transcriptional regulator [Okeania sp. SIO1I7]
MRLEQLQAFLCVAETGSFQQAGRICNVTQSTVSRQVQALENEVGTPLFHRSTQAKLTLAGECLWPYAKKICQAWESATQEIAEMLAGKQPELCVAAIHSVCAAYLPPVLQRFCRHYPEVKLRVTALGSDRTLKVLKDGLVDIAIVMNNRLFTASPEMLVDVLYTEPIEVLMAANHPLTKYDQIPWSELIRYPQVVFKDGYGMQRLVKEQFERLGAKLNAALELNTLDAFRGVVRQGNLIALLPHSALIDVKLDPTLAIKTIGVTPTTSKVSSIKDSVWSREVVVVTTSDRIQIPPIEYFWELVKELIPQQINQTTTTLKKESVVRSQ